MLLATITGCVITAVKEERLSGLRFLLAQPSGQAGPIVAADPLGARVGDTVLLASGGAARLALNHPDAPVDAAIVAIVDHATGLS